MFRSVKPARAAAPPGGPEEGRDDPREGERGLRRDLHGPGAARPSAHPGPRVSGKEGGSAGCVSRF